MQTIGIQTPKIQVLEHDMNVAFCVRQSALLSVFSACASVCADHSLVAWVAGEADVFVARRCNAY
eukprot:858233-Amphidinium_carterae.1